MASWVRNLQDRICAEVERLDGEAFQEDLWDRPGGGGGRSRVLQEGRFFEKAGVNTSRVHGTLEPAAAAAMRAKRELPPGDLAFWATGISLVLHPRHPMVPTVHANYRYFEINGGRAPGTWWYGGGADLTPSYLFDEDATHFHAQHKAALDPHGTGWYPRFKEWCDRYFFIPHRGEARGVGGIFFDDLDEGPSDALFELVRDCGEAFLPSYLPIVERRRELPYDDHHRAWQQLRRGRYVEFNLVYDRGTLFGLKTAARIESVLMSLPLTARWEYDHQPEPGSQEARLLEVLRNPRDWV